MCSHTQLNTLLSSRCSNINLQIRILGNKAISVKSFKVMCLSAVLSYWRTLNAIFCQSYFFFFRCVSYYSFYLYSKLQITVVGGNDSYIMTEQSCVQDKNV